MEVTWNANADNLLKGFRGPRKTVRNNIEPYSLETKMRILEEEFYALENEYMDATLDFLTVTNEYGVKVIT